MVLGMILLANKETRTFRTAIRATGSPNRLEDLLELEQVKVKYLHKKIYHDTNCAIKWQRKGLLK
jgi:hypothetical protein